MRITLSFLFFCILFSSASNSYSQKFTIKSKTASIKEVCKEIEKGSDYVFIFSDNCEKLIDKKVNVEANSKDVMEVLDAVLSSTGLTYKILDKQIVVYKSTETTPSVAVEQPDMNIIQQPAKKQITGKIVDVQGEAIIGANIIETGTTNGTVTDIDGKFSLSVSNNATIRISFIGYLEQSIATAGQSTFTITLLEDTKALDEVVVVGYGTMKKSDLTGSVSTITGEDISKRHTVKVADALQGSTPGLLVTRNGNAPNANPDIKIRGITTIGNSNPLVIVDGVPGSIDQVNPNDIQNISILKDAASASIYGSQAAAGVILITTKRAKSGDVSLNYQLETGISKPTRMPKYVSAVRNMQIQNEMIWNDNKNTGSEYPTFSKDLIDNYADLHNSDPDNYPDTDWFDLMLNDNAPLQSHILSATFGSDRLFSKLSLGYDKTNAIYDNNTYERITIRSNNDYTINKHLVFKTDLYYYRAISKQPTISIGLSSSLPPQYPAVWSDGRVAPGNPGHDNWYANMKYGGFNNAWSDVYGANFSLVLSPLDGLTLTALVAPKIYVGQGKFFSKAIPFTNLESPDVIAGYIGGNSNTSLTESRYNQKGYTSQLLSEYKKTIGKSDFTLLVGNENYYNHFESLRASSQNYALTNYPFLDLGNVNYLSNGGNAYENAYVSFLGRIIYNYNKKYLLQLNSRIDGSSRFDSRYRWGTFPSMSIGWIVSEEPFMKNFDNLSFLKIRASWGRLGNERIGNYPYQSTITFGTGVFFKGGIPTGGQTAYIPKYAISDISWETTENTDIGFDLYAFNNKLKIIGDYYFKNTKDMLLALEIPKYMGVSNPDQNTGKMNTKGWDLDLSWNDKMGDINYSVSLNISDYNSVMGDLGGTEFLGNQVKFEGSEFNEWYGYKSDGLYLSEDQLNNSAKINNTVTVGDVKYIDITGPDGIPDGKISPEYDRVLLGGSLPRYLYGGNLNLNYKNFDFSLVFQGVGKQKSLSYQLGLNTRWTWYDYFDGNYWSKYNTDEQNAKVKYPRLAYPTIEQTKNTIMSDYWLINGAYFRLKSITLGYTIPKNIINKLFMKNARIYASASDIFSIDNYPPGLDPETVFTGYWLMASYRLGISITF